MSEPRGAQEGKRKPTENDDVVLERLKKARKNDAVRDGKRSSCTSSSTAATEEEVEEFFAILRRIHLAIGHFRKAGDGRNSTEDGSRLRVMLEREIIISCDEANGVKDDGEEARPEREEGMEENLDIDLNAEPGPDSDPV